MIRYLLSFWWAYRVAKKCWNQGFWSLGNHVFPLMCKNYPFQKPQSNNKPVSEVLECCNVLKKQPQVGESGATCFKDVWLFHVLYFLLLPDASHISDECITSACFCILHKEPPPLNKIFFALPDLYCQAVKNTYWVFLCETQRLGSFQLHANSGA